MYCVDDYLMYVVMESNLLLPFLKKTIDFFFFLRADDDDVAAAIIM